ETKDQFADVCLAGRIMSVRDMGKANFCVLQDAHGKIQLYIRRDDICPGEDKSLYDIVWKKLIDLGDIIGVKGYAFITKTGETSVLQSIPGGAAARPFVTHHNALDVPFYLRIANELYLKRLIVGGFDWVYEFSRNFRNEGMDRTHNPEFTILEFYTAYKDYFWMMNVTERLLEKAAIDVTGSTEITVGDK